MTDESGYFDVLEQLGSMWLLRGVSLADRELLLCQMERQTYPAGAIVFEKGAPAGHVYVILEGRARVFVRAPLGHELTLRTFVAGDAFGEVAALDGRPRASSAQAETALEVLALTRADLLAFLEAHPLVGLALMRVLVERVRFATHTLQHVMVALDVLALGDYGGTPQTSATSDPAAEMQRHIDAFLEAVRQG